LGPKIEAVRGMVVTGVLKAPYGGLISKGKIGPKGQIPNDRGQMGVGKTGA